MINLKTLLFPSISDRQIKIVMIITIVFLISDTMISIVPDYLVAQTTSFLGISYFVVLSVMYAISQQSLISFSWLKTKAIRSKSFLFNGLLKIVIVCQFILLTILILLLYQILFMSQYYTVLLIWSTIISLSLTTIILSILSRQFILWYRYHRSDSFIVLAYSIAFIVMSIAYTSALFMDVFNLSNKQEIVTPNSEISFPNFDDNWLLLIFSDIYQYSDLISFVFIWGATALLLLPYRKRLGLLKFWIVICLPLVYFLSSFVEVIGLYEPQSDSEIFYFYLYTSLNSTAGGLLFGITFMIIAKQINNQRIKGYMNLAAYGFILLFISNQITLVATSYPPFGIATLLFSGLSSYLLLIGLYSTAVSLSQHSQLRKSIRNSLDKQHSKLLDNIGISELQREMDRRITPVIQRYAKQMNMQSAIDLSISEEEVKQYMEEVLHDLHEK